MNDSSSFLQKYFLFRYASSHQTNHLLNPALKVQFQKRASDLCGDEQSSSSFDFEIRTEQDLLEHLFWHLSGQNFSSIPANFHGLEAFTPEMIQALIQPFQQYGKQIHTMSVFCEHLLHRSSETCLTLQAFASAVHGHIFRLIHAILDMKQTQPPTSVLELQLKLDQMSYCQQLSSLVDFTEFASSLTGSSSFRLASAQLLSFLWKELQLAVSSKEEAIIRLVFNLFLHTIKPYFTLLDEWLATGKCNDLFCEFFVQPRSNSSAEWLGNYSIEPTHIPSFLSDLSLDILETSHIVHLSQSLVLSGTNKTYSPVTPISTFLTFSHNLKNTLSTGLFHPAEISSIALQDSQKPSNENPLFNSPSLPKDSPPVQDLVESLQRKEEVFQILEAERLGHLSNKEAALYLELLEEEERLEQEILGREKFASPEDNQKLDISNKLNNSTIPDKLNNSIISNKLNNSIISDKLNNSIISDELDKSIISDNKLDNSISDKSPWLNWNIQQISPLEFSPKKDYFPDSFHFARNQDPCDINLLNFKFYSKKNKGTLKFFPMSQLLEMTIKNPLKDYITKVNGQFTDIIFSEYELVSLLSDLRNYYFLQNGPLFHTFCQTLFEKMDQSKGWKDINFLNRILQDNQEKAPKFGSRFTFELLPQPQTIDTIIDLELLKLNINIDWPLNFLIDTKCLELYQPIFLFLLQIRRAKYDLEQIQLKSLLQLQSPQMKLFLELRSRLLFFINQFYDFAASGIIVGPWQSVLHKLKQAKTFREIYQIHKDYLESIRDGLFLNSKAKSVLEAIKKILRTAIPVRKILEKIQHCSDQTALQPEMLTKLHSQLRQQLSESWNFFLLILEQTVSSKEVKPCLESLYWALSNNPQEGI